MKPMLARLVRDLPDAGEGYVYEPKWDGFRCLARRDGEAIELCSRHGRPLERYFPEPSSCRVEQLDVEAPAAGRVLRAG